MAEKFHILEFPEDNHYDAKEFSKIAKNAADLTEDYAIDSSLDALNTLLSIAEATSKSPIKSTEFVDQATSVAKDTLEQASLMIEEVKRFKTLSAEIAKHT